MTALSREHTQQEPRLHHCPIGGMHVNCPGTGCGCPCHTICFRRGCGKPLADHDYGVFCP